MPPGAAAVILRKEDALYLQPPRAEPPPTLTKLRPTKLHGSREALGVHAQPLLSPDSHSKLEAEASAMTAKSFMTVNEWQSLTNGSAAMSLPDIEIL
jgi:hypothetical protein